MTRTFAVLGALLAALAVAAGALGAHTLEGSIPPDRLDTFKLGAQYQMYHALGLLIVAWATTQWPGLDTNAAGWLFVGGIVIFCGSLYGIGLGAPVWLGAAAPIGGLSFISGWLLLAWAVVQGD